jgi:hypothetical protein
MFLGETDTICELFLFLVELGFELGALGLVLVIKKKRLHVLKYIHRLRILCLNCLGPDVFQILEYLHIKSQCKVGNAPKYKTF